jgi:uncharacterized protein
MAQRLGQPLLQSQRLAELLRATDWTTPSAAAPRAVSGLADFGAPSLIVVQPTPFCNVDCGYCYLSDRSLRVVMSLDVIDSLATKLLPSLGAEANTTLVWHGGEPTMAPIGWYDAATERLRRAGPVSLQLAMQTNAMAIDAAWIALFKRTRTIVGVSIDGPQRFHDRRRVTRQGRGTHAIGMRGVKRLQDADMNPSVITVLSASSLADADEYFAFYRDAGLSNVSFNIDEQEGANPSSSFAAVDKKAEMAAFLLRLLRLSRETGYFLAIREVERISAIWGLGAPCRNEQVEPWGIISIDHRGDVSTFSPEFLDVKAAEYNNFRFGSVLDQGPTDWARDAAFAALRGTVVDGVAACRDACSYFAICGGGAPVNKYCERRSAAATETAYCRMTTQAAADALLQFIAESGSRPGAAR